MTTDDSAAGDPVAADAAAERPAADQQFWIDTSAVPSLAPAPRPSAPLPPCFNPLDTVCLTVVGAHLLALALALFAAVALWPLPTRWGPVSRWPTFLLDLLPTTHFLLLTLWLWCGPRPLWLRALAAVAAGAVMGVATMGSPFELAFMYLFGPACLCFWLMVGLSLAAAELEIVHVAQARASLPRKAVQFTIRTMIYWTLLAAIMLGVGKWLAASPHGAGALFALFGALWGVSTGLLMLREPFFPLPAWWQLLSLVVVASGAGAAAGLGADSILPGGAFLLTAISGVGTLYILRRFDYRLQITTLEKHLRKVRDIVLPASEPTDESWRELGDQDPVQPARDP